MAYVFPTIKNLGSLRLQLNAAFAAIFGSTNTFTAAQAFPAAGITLGGLKVLSGTGSPAGAVAAPVGSLYLRSDGGTSTSLYMKETGATTNAGWVAK